MNLALIVAGGSGSRMGADLPKQYLDLAGRPILCHAVAAFSDVGEIDAICIVCHSDYLSHVQDMLSCYPKARYFAPAGHTRRDSVYSGLRSLVDVLSPEDIVLIHDAARPFVSPALIRENIRAALDTGACITACPAQDTIVEAKGKEVDRVLNRSALYQVQTPQSFRYGTILQANQAYDALDHPPAVTDDGSLVLLAGGRVTVVPGEKQNMKITTPEDLLWAEFLLAQKN